MRTDLLLPITLDTWVTSDHHWGHDNIRRYQNRPDDHFQLMRDRWFRIVSAYDIVLHLGDLACFGPEDRHQTYVAGLPGQKFLLKGNHDHHSGNWYRALGFTPIGRKPFLVTLNGIRICFSTRLPP